MKNCLGKRHEPINEELTWTRAAIGPEYSRKIKVCSSGFHLTYLALIGVWLLLLIVAVRPEYLRE
jgi:nitrate reductase gamma subunit